MFAHHQTQYCSWQLTRRLSSEDEDTITSAIKDTQIDLDAHQVGAVMFAFKNTFSNGVLPVDAESLGNSLETGRVIAQERVVQAIDPDRRTNYSKKAES